MGELRNENYVTETIFIPLYNRSLSFRKMISKKFQKENFGNSIRFTGDENKNNPENKYGCPDARSDLGNIIEIKTKATTNLYPNESAGGDKGNGYEKYLCDYSDKLLLYVVPDGYDWKKNKRVNIENRVQILTWREIVNFLREQNDSDPLIGLIYNKVDNVEVEQVKTLESYKAKVYEVMTRLCALNGAISVNLDENNSINNPFLSYPEEMKETDWAGIDFSYGGFAGEIWFGKKDIWLYFRIDEIGYEDILLEQGFEYDDGDAAYIMRIISQDDFWKKDSEELTLIFNSCILSHQYAWNEINNKQNFEYPSILFSKVKPELEIIAKKHSLELDDDEELIKEGFFYFNTESWRYGFEFDNDDWGDFFYGIKYFEKNDEKNISKQNKKLLINILKGSSENTDWYPSWKYADDPYRNWNGDTFQTISDNPKQFAEYIDSKLSEMERALKKIGLL